MKGAPQVQVECAGSASVDLEKVEELHLRLGRLAQLEDPALIASLSTELLEALRMLQQDISLARDRAVLKLHASGRSLHEIARGAGLTRGRVFQIVQRGRAEGSVLADSSEAVS